MADIFSHFGIRRSAFPHELVDSEKGALLIVGGGRCVWDDVDSIGDLTMLDVMCVNDVGMYWPGAIRHWYSNNADQLENWYLGTRTRYRREFRVPLLHSCHVSSKIVEPFLWPFPATGGSGVVACYVALALGYSRIVLAGLPFDDSGHFFDPPNHHRLVVGRETSHFTREVKDRTLRQLASIADGRIRAVSGRFNEFIDLDRV